MLSQKFNVVSTKGNLNSETGLPLSVFGIKKENEVGVFELGMNRAGEMSEISRVLKANFAIVTNIGTAHIGRLGSHENIAAEKKHALDFIQNDGVALIPKADDFAQFLSKDVKGKVIFYGENENRVKFVSDEGLFGSTIDVDGVKVHVPLPGKHNALDAIAAAELSLYLGVSAQKIKEATEKLSPLGGRSEILRGKYTVIKDCYNANPDSMESAISLVRSVQEKNVRKILVLGEMLELGADRARIWLFWSATSF